MPLRLSRTTRLVPLAVVLAATLLAGGCVFGGHKDVHQTGQFVSGETIATIEPGVTKTDWVLATLGQPSAKTTLADGQELWSWRGSRRVESSGYVLFVFGGRDRTYTESTTYVRLKDGVVNKVWRDGPPENSTATTEATR
jgi:predicted small secreted protein